MVNRKYYVTLIHSGPSGEGMRSLILFKIIYPSWIENKKKKINFIQRNCQVALIFIEEKNIFESFVFSSQGLFRFFFSFSKSTTFSKSKRVDKSQL